MNKVVNIVVLALTALVVATAATKSITGRSSRWDQMIHDHGARHKRQLREWRIIGESCDDLGNLTRFDQHGRRDSGLLAPVANQERCGSCWAFAAAHAVTDTRNIAAGRQLDLLSAQYTARCATENFIYGYGCCGGWPRRALLHYRDIGVATDVCLPYNELTSKAPTDYGGNYKAANPLTCFSTCADGSAFDPGSITIDNIQQYTYNENTIINALNNGNVVIVRLAVNMDIGTYKCGVLTTTSTLKVLGYHAVVIVDYGSTDTGTDFWVIKNSWGSEYGESGYFRLRRGPEQFGIGSSLVYIPLLSPDSTLPPSNLPAEAEIQRTCAPQEVTEPLNNVFTMSAVEFALQGLVDQVQCPNGAAATSLNLTSFDNANVQVVAGTMVELIVDVSVEGCGATVENRLTFTVFINFDGTFSLSGYTINDITENTAKILTASMLLLFAMVVINLVINN